MRMSVQDKLELEIDEIVAHGCGYKSLFAFSFLSLGVKQESGATKK